MAQNETVVTIVGNLTGDPELRFTPSGAPVVNFTVASTPRFFDRQTNEWKDGETLFMRCSMWRGPAENAAESFRRGNRVVAVGRLTSRSYKTKEGENRTVVELACDELAASVRNATVRVTKVNREAPGADSPGSTVDPWSPSDATVTPLATKDAKAS